MSDTESDIIQPSAAPLSHLNKEKQRRGSGFDWRIVGLGAVVLGVLIFALSWRPEITPPATTGNSNATQNLSDTSPTPASTQTPELAPFAASQQQRAREKAQEALAAFVEHQIQLEETMDVAQWGQAELDAALTLAQSGDAEFASENFDAALELYDQAVAQLQALLQRGDDVFAEHIAQTQQHIDALNADEALYSIGQALAIKAEDATALALQQRASNLPEIVSLLRTAKNHELGGRPAEALAVYAQIAALDPDTKGLNRLRAEAAAAQANNKVAQHLSRAFKLLSDQQFNAARGAFNAALQIEPDNDIAKGGLAQLAKENDLAVIKAHQQQADAAIEEENWQVAIDAYSAVLQMDNNIQFARNGLNNAKAHQRSSNLLNRIAAEPQKLSRQALYLEAVDIVNAARNLEFQGPKMREAIQQVDTLIILYRDPVDVVLVSDNATEVIMSNVGQLGRFDRKTLSLRPGQYTIRGSQDGCRDIYLSIEVLPGIAPVEVACQESL
ncbi:MAG: hypothetical protein AAF993_05720 [Pseudomonadota bacterium]